MDFSDAPATPQQALWYDLLSGMPEFLVRWQRHTQQVVSARQWRDVHYLFAVWRQQNDLPDDVQAYALRLRPLLCHNAEHQQQFLACWLAHWSKSNDSGKALLSDRTTRTQTQQQLEQASAGERFAPIRQRLNRQSWIALLLFCLLLSVLIGIGYDWRHSDVITPVPVVEHNAKPPDEPSDTTPAAQPTIQDEKPYLQSLPLRQPPPAYRVDQAMQHAQYGFFASIAVLFLLPLCWLWYRQRVIFDTAKASADASEDLALKAPRQSLAQLLGSGFKNLIGRLRFAQSGEQRIDWQKTVQATARSAGYPQLRYGQRHRQADFVLIADRSHRDDQSVWLLGQLQDGLKQAQIRVHRYHFDRHPQWLWREARSAVRPETLAQVLLLHPGSRVLLVVEHEVLFYRLSGEPQAWLKSLHGLPHYQLALLTRPNTQQITCLQLGHYPFRLIDSLKDIGPLLDFSLPQPPCEVQMSEDFRRDWLGNLPPENPAAVLAWIEQNHGADVLRFLGLLAIYPGLHGDLTHELFQHFSDNAAGSSPSPCGESEARGAKPVGVRAKASDTSIRRWFLQALLALTPTPLPKGEGLKSTALRTKADSKNQQDFDKPDTLSFTPATLINTVSLPWCRQGWLPRWLRQSLLDKLDLADHRRAKAFFIKLFSSEKKLGHSVQLQLQKPQGFWFWQWLRYLMHRAAPDSPLRDGIFARVLLMPRWQWLDNSLPRRLLQALPNLLISQWPLRIALVLLFCGLMFSANWAWQQHAQPWYAQYRLNQHRAANQALTVTLRYHPSASRATDALGKGLSAMGYSIARIADANVQQNRIAAPAAYASELQDIAGYMTWGASFAVDSEAIVATIDLATLPQTGQVFRDVYSKAVVYPSYPNNLAWQNPLPAGEDRVRAKEPDLSTNSLVKQTSLALTPPPLPQGEGLKPILPNMRLIPSGEFLMGSPPSEAGRYNDEGPQHTVKLKTFELAETELTFEEWDRCVTAKVCRAVDDEGWGRGQRPVIHVSWNDAQVYIRWLNQTQGLTGKQAYRLPSEAEWEYAVRVGSQTPYYWKVGKTKQCDYANGWDKAAKDSGKYAFSWESAACADGYVTTAPVKSFKSNAWGLYDMSGNVWEWVEDCWHNNYQDAPVYGIAWQAKDCKERLLRGGAWNDIPSNLRSANRFRIWSADTSFNVGFRLARTPDFYPTPR